MQEKFLNEAAGKEMTVADYFKQQYKRMARRYAGMTGASCGADWGA